MIILAYAAVLLLTLWLFRARHRGRTVEGLIRKPSAGSDLIAVVSTLSYLEHELIKHRIPVVRSLVAKRVWNEDDRRLLARTIGAGDSAMRSEFRRYIEGIQRGAGRTLVNVGRDPAFARAEQAIDQIQKQGERWLRNGADSSPPQRERDAVEQACSWLSGPFRRYLVELNRSVYRCPITRAKFQRSARRGLVEAGTKADLIVDEPPSECVASILPSDLDVVVRNLVRNAAQVELPEGTGAAIRIDVAELVEETGEESILISVHDRSPRLLSTDDIYGRDASRGLGLVTTALARHGGAVRCVNSSQSGYTKALRVRLARALHDPDSEALSVGRSGSRAYLLLAVVAVIHTLLIALVVVPYFAAHPYVGATPEPPAGCVIETGKEGAELTVLCDLFDSGGALRNGPILLEWSSGSADPGRLVVDGSDCMTVAQSAGRNTVVANVERCLEVGQFEPALSLRFSTFWRRADYHVQIELRSSTSGLIDASRAAVAEADVDLAERLTDYLLTHQQRALTPVERHQVLYWRALANVIDGLHQRGFQSDSPTSDPLCDAFQRVEQSAQEMIALAEAEPEPRRAEWNADARYLLALASLFVTASMEGAASLFSELASGDGQAGRAQTARFFLAILQSEGAPGAALGSVDALLSEMWLTYQRPPVPDPQLNALLVDLVGATDGAQVARVPVPEALCAFRHNYPDISLPAVLVFTLAHVCGRSPVDPRIDDYVEQLGEYVRRARSPLSCP